MSLTLHQLLKLCTVRIKTAKGGSQGTGFFIAPHIILTCAHVIGKHVVGEFVEVFPDGSTQPLQAEIKEIFPNGIDLAILLTTEEVSSTCVYLDKEIQSRDSCYTYGYTDAEQGFPDGDPVTLECEGITGGSSPLIKLKGGQVRPGLSGSPLLNLRTGKVCGVIKRTRNRSSDLGGEGISIEIVFDQYPRLIAVQHDFHKKDQRWSELLNPDVEAFDSDWVYLDQASQRRRNYLKALWFLIKVICKWILLGRKAPKAFPFKTITLLIEHTLKGNLGQEIKKQRREITQRLNLEVDPEGINQAKVLNEIDSQAWVLINLLNMLVGDEQDLASTSRLLWATEILYDQRSFIREIKKKEGNSYPRLEDLKKRFKIFDDADDTRYVSADRIISRLVTQHTNTNFIVWDSLKTLLDALLEQITRNPKFNLMYVERIMNLLIINCRDSLSAVESPVEAMLAGLEEEIKKNPKLKILRKVQVLLQSAVGELVEGGPFRAWSEKGVYHFSRRCKLYPERVKQQEMKQILCYNTLEEAQKKHKPCKICKAAEKSPDNETEFLGEEPE